MVRNKVPEHTKRFGRKRVTAKDDRLSIASDEEQAAAVRKGNVFDFCRPKKKTASALRRDLLYSLTWSQPATKGIPPSPRYGHSMTALGKHIFLFGGNDGTQSFDSLFVLDVERMVWFQPACSGVAPSARHSHTATALPNDRIMVWGGVSGGTSVHMLETVSSTWHEETHVIGTPPSSRWGHSSVLIGYSVFIVGGHDGTKSLHDLHEFDLTTLTWTEPKVQGKAPTPGENHATCWITGTDRFLLLGGSEVDTFKELHQFEKTYTRWAPMETEGHVPPSRKKHTALLVDNNVFVFGGTGGGQTLNDTHVLSMSTMRWAEPKIAGRAPAPRCDHNIALVQDRQGTRMFLFGGHDGQQPLNDLYALVTMTWSKEEQTERGLPPRLGMSATMVGNRLILMGGARSGVAYNDIHVYNMETHSWFVPRMSGSVPRALVAHSAVNIGNELLVFGGGNGLDAGNPLLVVDINTFAWDIPAVEGLAPVSNYGHAACLYSRQMFVFGGYNTETGYSNELYVLDTAKMSWHTPYANGTTPRGRVGHTFTLVETKIVLFGGSQRDTLFDDVHVLDIPSMTWTRPIVNGNKPPPRYNHSAAAIGQKMFFFGGLVSPTDVGMRFAKAQPDWRRHGRHFSTSDLYLFDIENVTWDQPKVAGIGPSARFRHAVAVTEAKMLIISGHGGGSDIWALDTGILAEVSNITKKRPEAQKPKIVAKPELDAQDSMLNWLRDLGMEKYSRLFQKAEIDWNSIAELTNEDLEELGITALGPRKKLLTAIENKRQAHDDTDVAVAADLYQRRYRLEGSVVFGGNTMKLGTDMKTGRKVALKFLSDIEQFKREVSLFQLLRSQHVAECYDNYQDPKNEAHCIVLEFSAHSLVEHMTGEMERNHRKFVFDKLARIIQHIHSHNVVHCNFSPTSVCLFGPVWKIVDLSYARPVGDRVPQRVIPLYCSPEWAKAIGAESISRMDASTTMDIWAMGAVFVEMFTGQPFMRTTTQGVLATLQSFAEIELPLKYLNEDRQALHLAQKMLRKVPLERPNIMGVMRHAYLAGGLDTEQMGDAFEFVRNSQQTLKNQLVIIEKHLSKPVSNNPPTMQAQEPRKDAQKPKTKQTTIAPPPTKE